MDWIQIGTVIGALGTALFVFYSFHKEEIQSIKEIINRIETHHREDMQKMDMKLEKMDEKWERLFERLLLKDQAGR